MAFGGEVDDGVDVEALHRFAHGGGVADVGVEEHVAVPVFRGDVREAFRVARVGERVVVHDAPREIRLFEDVPDEIGADEAGAASHEEVLEGSHVGRLRA